MNKFIFLLLVILITSSAAQDFTPIVGNNGFATSTDLRGSYTQGGQNGAHVADIYFKTTIPSFNIDENGVAGIDCNNNQITLNLNDASPIAQIQNWPDQVLLFVSHKWNCLGKQTTQYFTVQNRTIDANNKKVTFNSVQTDIKDVSSEFNIDVSWNNGGGNNKRHARRRSNKRAINLSNTIDLSVLFDESSGQSSKPNFPLVTLSQNNTSESLVCANCFTQGQATISLKLAGSLPTFKLTDATITLNGNIKFNLDMAINGKVGASVSPLDVQILSVPLSPLSIPALFNVGPSIDLAASSKISADITGSFRTGGEIDYPNFSATANFVDSPTFKQSGFQAQTKPHPPSIGFTVSASISGSLKPQLAFGLEAIGGLFNLKVGFDLVTTLGNKVSIGSNSGCSNATQPHITSQIDGDLGFFVESNDFPIVTFPTASLLDKCI